MSKFGCRTPRSRRTEAPLDVDLGQRADVIKGKTFDELDTAFGGKRDFWLTGFGDYGNPSSLGVLTYASDCSDATACLRDVPAPQPADRPLSWSASGFINDIKSPQASRVPEYVRGGREPDKRLTLQLTSRARRVGELAHPGFRKSILAFAVHGYRHRRGRKALEHPCGGQGTVRLVCSENVEFLTRRIPLIHPNSPARHLYPPPSTSSPQ